MTRCFWRCALLFVMTAALAGCGGSAIVSSEKQNPPITPAPTVVIQANPADINSGQSATLAWSSTNATSVTISPSISTSSLPSSGSATVAPQATTTYTATAKGTGGSATSAV